MGLFHTNNPTGCGIAVYNKEGKITEFVEKPKYPKSDLANAGIYVVNKRIYDYIPTNHLLILAGMFFLNWWEKCMVIQLKSIF